MTPPAAAALLVAVLAAAANWWSRWSAHRSTELWSKPLTLVALIAAACTLDPADPAVRAWFVAALVLSLAGDVLLLAGDRWFVGGLAAFLLAHLAYVAGFVAAEPWRWWACAAVVPALAVVAATAGRRIVAGAGRHDAALRLPVTGYLVVISAMVVAAAAAGDAWALAGAALFLISDSVLGWSRFVEAQRWMPVTIMVTYHLAQGSLVVSLLA